MSLQWTLVAGFLYLEIFIVLLLILPFISAKKWSSLFKSRFVNAVAAQGHIYFVILLGILVVLWLDSMREMHKYGQEQADMDHGHLGAEMQLHMKRFRAQRNFYLAGFSLFLCLVLRRLASLVSKQATLEAEKAAAMKQAESATKAAQSLLEKDENEGANQDNAVAELKEQLNEAQEKLRVALKDKEAMSSQAKSVMNEYDRLLKEHEDLQKEKSQASDKKDD